MIQKQLTLLAKCLMVAIVLSSSGASFAQAGLSKTERPLPEFELPGIDDATWDSDALEGKLWIINFWASWCPPCIEEMPSMNEAWHSVKDEGIGMLAINAGEGEQTVKQFLTRISIDFPVLIGDGNTLPNWSVRALPTTIVVNQQGEVVFEALGPRDWADEALLDQVRALL